MVLRCSLHHGCIDGTYSLQTRNDGASVAGDVSGVKYPSMQIKVDDRTNLHLSPQKPANLLVQKKIFVSQLLLCMFAR